MPKPSQGRVININKMGVYANRGSTGIKALYDLWKPDLKLCQQLSETLISGNITSNDVIPRQSKIILAPKKLPITNTIETRKSPFQIDEKNKS